MIEIKSFTIGDLATNCYLLKDTTTEDLAVVDPANDEIIDLLRGIKCDFSKIKYIILTHGHFDHIYGVNSLKKLTDAKVLISEDEKQFLSNNNINLSTGFLPPNGMEKIIADEFFKDGSIINLGNSEIKVMLTPGHTAGSVCLLFDDKIISGDTLFCESIGRTDLPTGDMNAILRSLAKLKMIDGSFKVYPGHGRATTLEHEKKYNFYMN